MRETVRELGERKGDRLLEEVLRLVPQAGPVSPDRSSRGLSSWRPSRRSRKRLFAAAPGAHFVLARLEQEHPRLDEVELDLPISIYGGGWRDSTGRVRGTSHLDLTKGEHEMASSGTHRTRRSTRGSTPRHQSRPAPSRETSADPYAGITRRGPLPAGSTFPRASSGMLTALDGDHPRRAGRRRVRRRRLPDGVGEERRDHRSEA